MSGEHAGARRTLGPETESDAACIGFMRLCVMVALTVLCSCVHHGKDVKLLPGRESPSVAYASLGTKPYLNRWADFEVFRNAAIEMEHLTCWEGRRAVAGHSLAIRLSEGFKIENTTAHPQYFEIWMQIPEDLPVHVPYLLYPAARIRATSRQKRWPSGELSKYSQLKEGEMLVSGMQGYDCPRLGGLWGAVATLTIIRRSADHLTFRLTGNLPIRQDGMRMSQKFGYTLKVDREYKVVFKPIKG
ncbi:MAG: hypothetical protein B7Z47_01520 [Chthoniobacter sp. 12-60-6]|nr:MAG: hypothetical protein B7Z47_01520 [Chthoniobacter sp. 12-60-6]